MHNQNIHPIPHQSVDPFAGGPTAIPTDGSTYLSIADGLDSGAVSLAMTKREAAKRARAAALSMLMADGSVPSDWQRHFNGTQIRKLGDRITALLANADTGPSGRAKTVKSFVAAVRRLRDLIPLVPQSALNRCIHQPPDFAPALHHALELYRSGVVAESALKRVADDVSRSAGARLSPALPLEPGIEELIERLPVGGAAPWIELVPGVEARPFHDDAHARVYKPTPIQQMLSTVGGWQDEGRIHLVPPSASDAHPLLDSDGGLPLFDRVVLNNSVCGHAITDIVGLVVDDGSPGKNHGKWLVAQEFLPADSGQLAEAGRVHDWATRHGHAPLPPQADQPESAAPKVGGDAITVPVLVRVDGKHYLGIDINARNALMVGGRVIPFDTVWREVPASAFNTNPQLRQARAQIAAGRDKLPKTP